MNNRKQITLQVNNLNKVSLPLKGPMVISSLYARENISLVGRASNHNTQNEEPYIKQSLSEFI
jgi:hypothetical protein